MAGPHRPGRHRVPRRLRSQSERPLLNGDFTAPSVERALEALRDRLVKAPFEAPSTDDLNLLGLTEQHLSAAARAGMLLRLPGNVVLLPDAVEQA